MFALGTALLVVIGLASAQGGDIDGNIVITRKLTRRKVTAPVSAYSRGVAVELGADPADDPLVYERTRVVIYLEGQIPSKPVTAVLEQKNRRFVPETLVVPAGSTVSFPNLDPIFHNVFSLSKSKSFDLGNYPKDHTRTVTFPTPGIVFLNCHLHPNMAAAIVVSPNQWCTKADGAGRFTISGAPAGAHTIVAWHKAAGFFRQKIKISEAQPTYVQFVIPIDEASSVNAVARR